MSAQQLQKQAGPVNLKAITLYTYEDCYILKPKDQKLTEINSILQVDRQIGNIKEITLQKFKAIEEQPINERDFSVFLGILHIYNVPFLLLGDEVKVVCVKDNKDIYEIQTVFFSNFQVGYDYSTPKGNRIYEYLQNIHKLFCTGFYFSYQINLTLTQQDLQEDSQQTRKDFMWNSYLMQFLEQKKTDPKWQIPIIQGFVGNFSQNLNGRSLSYYLISRKIIQHAGTRYNVRGVNDNGYTANQVETESIVYYNKYICSYVSIRGSVPIFWSQSSQSSNIKLSRNFELTHSAFIKHFQNIEQSYQRCLCVNLLTKQKSGEALLTENFEKHIKQANQFEQLQNIRYQYFDPNSKQKGQKDKMNEIINKLTLVIESLGFHAQDQEDVDKVILWNQTGVFRINCLDCLEKTNLFQSKLALKVFTMQLQKMGIDTKSNKFFQTDSLDAFDVNKGCHPFLIAFKNIWQEQNDYLSHHYSSGSSHTVNKSQAYNLKNKGILSMVDQQLKNAQKYLSTTFEDSAKQDCIQLVLGTHHSILNVFQNRIGEALKKRIHDYCTFKDTSIFIVTWNMNGKVPKQGGSFPQNLFDFKGQPNPDIIVVGLQEMVKLNTKNVIMTNNEKIVETWTQELTQSLKNIDDYILIKTRDLVGIFIAVFVRRSLSSIISNVNSDEVKTGLMGGTFGNKGACLIRLKIYDSNVCFICCHLESGQKQNNERLQSIEEIHVQGFENDRHNFRFESNCDFSILFGDMNFRLKTENQVVREALQSYKSLKSSNQLKEAQSILETLLQEDQLLSSKQIQKYLQKYQEAQITFPPTYKYNIGTQVYDTSKKMRTPSYTDRILMWKQNELKCEQKFYDRLELLDSDHRPVITYFQLQVKELDQNAYEYVMRDLHNSVTKKSMELDLQFQEQNDQEQQQQDNSQNQELQQQINNIQNSQENSENINQYFLQFESQQQSDNQQQQNFINQQIQIEQQIQQQNNSTNIISQQQQNIQSENPIYNNNIQQQNQQQQEQNENNNSNQQNSNLVDDLI